MDQLFLAIQAQLHGSNIQLPYEYVAPLYVALWNNQAQYFENDSDQDTLIPFQRPAIFIEFLNDLEIEQLGNGVQIFDPLTIRVHIIVDQFDAMDGTMEQNLSIFPFKQQVYATLQGFEPQGAVAFVRIQETQDYEHTNIYHFMQDYRTNYVDFGVNKPVNGVPATLPIAIIINKEIDTSL